MRALSLELGAGRFDLVGACGAGAAPGHVRCLFAFGASTGAASGRVPVAGAATAGWALLLAAGGGADIKPLRGRPRLLQLDELAIERRGAPRNPDPQRPHWSIQIYHKMVVAVLHCHDHARAHSVEL